MTDMNDILANRRRYYKEYFEKNKERLTEVFTCEDCGGNYKKTSKSTHVKTKKHQNMVLFKQKMMSEGRINNAKEDNKDEKNNCVLSINKLKKNVNMIDEINEINKLKRNNRDNRVINDINENIVLLTKKIRDKDESINEINEINKKLVELLESLVKCD